MDAPAIPDGTPDFFQITTTLAMELASQLSSPSDVFTRHGITEEDAVVILKDPQFQLMLKEAQKEWESEMNVAERIRLKASMALEELLLPTYQMAKDPRVPPVARNDSTKLFERLSGVSKSNEESGGGGGAKFALTINVNASDGPKEITGEVISQDE